MARIGFFSMPWRGHLNPMLALAGELQQRGHKTQFFHLPAYEQLIREQGQEFVAYGPAQLQDASQEGSDLQGEAAIAAALAQTQALARVCLAEAGPVVQKAELDLWVIDQLDYASACLAAALKAPFVTVAVTLLKNEEPGIPGFSGEAPEGSAALRLSQLVQPYRDQLTRFRLDHQLDAFDYATIWSNLAQISQQPVWFEFPRKHLPRCFHFTGPFLRPQQRPRVDFPWHSLNQAPLVYIAFGTALRLDPQLLSLLLKACQPLPIQVVVSLGGLGSEPWLGHVRRPRGLEGFEGQLFGEGEAQFLVVPYAPQWELLQKAEIAIHHAGLNTTLECLSAGIPMLALPRSHDQPGVAARIEWTGCGLWLRQPLEVMALRESLQKVLQEPDFRQRAREFQAQIHKTQGLELAADVIEQVIQQGKPILRRE